MDIGAITRKVTLEWSAPGYRGARHQNQLCEED